MAKMHQLWMLAFVLGYACQAQGIPIEDKELPARIKTARKLQTIEKEDNLEHVDSHSHPENVDTLALGRSHPEKLDKLALGRAPYSYYMKRFLAERRRLDPRKKNIVIVWDNADYETDIPYSGEKVWIGRHGYYVYQGSGSGFFELKSDGGWGNWSFSGSPRRIGNTLIYS